MGNICCRAESPCGSAEERSVLLKDDSKTAMTLGDTTAVGTCGPAGDDGISKTPVEENKKVELKAEAEAAEKELNNTQENGPLKKEATQTATPSPRKGSERKENSTRAQDEDKKECPAGDGKSEIQQCTLNCPQHATADWEVSPATKAPQEEEEEEEEEENPASAQDKVPDSRSTTVEAACPENTTETNRTDHIKVDTTPENVEETGSPPEPPGETPQNKEVLSGANTQLTAADLQVTSISAVSQVVNKESPSRAVTKDSESVSVCREDDPEVTTRSHDASESPPGTETTEPDHSEQDSANSGRESETTAPAESSTSSKSDKDASPDPDSVTSSSKEVPTVENMKQEEMILKERDEGGDGDVPDVKEKDEMKEEVETRAGKDAEGQEVTGVKEQLTGSTSTDIKADEVPVKEESEDDLGNSDEDLYRGVEELPASQKNKPAELETTLLKVEDRCSLAPAVDILGYSEREWKGNTAKSTLIRKGYKEMSQRFGSLRRVRGDNYCALRGTLFQVLSHSTELPVWLQEEDITMLPKQLEAQEGLISQWTFPGECLQGDGTGDAIAQLKGYIELLRIKWRAAVDCSSASERQQLCERVFQGGEEELGLLEALKLLMLSRAVELHGLMQAGGDVPLFCWLLFARDSSDCPRSFLSNHLRHVGLSAGLEQVEMFLLGYSLQCTIQVYRLYKADTEEFVTYYPDDHKDDWPSVCLVTEDDRHYNVPVVEASEHHEELDSS
uniref:OTU deubiquitinase with linear linkage specificity n=1 Tax=Labrus bergylta TaxID=56723 RepID=A0A3Q3GA03_9LABR|nr:ubiquitin thioesterase otulin [Labrus bergylta]